MCVGKLSGVNAIYYKYCRLADLGLFWVCLSGVTGVQTMENEYETEGIKGTRRHSGWAGLARGNKALAEVAVSKASD